MNPSQIPFNALVVGPTGCGKTKFVVDQIKGQFRGKFDYIVLLCPTYTRNRSWDGVGDNDDRFFVLTPSVDAVESYLRFLAAHFASSSANTLLILDDVACGDDVKKRNNSLIWLAFSGRHDGISVWLITQQLTSVAKPFRENVGALAVFYTPSKADLKAIFHDYGAELSESQIKEHMKVLKQRAHSKMVFSLRHPYKLTLI